MFKKSLLAVLMTASLSTAAMATMKGEPSIRDKQQAACAKDVQKLCADSMPDVEKVTTCMAGKKAMVSPECAKMYDAK